MVALHTVPGMNGAAPVFAAPTASDKAEIGSTLIVKNGSAAAITVTLITPGNLATGDSYPDKTYSVAAGSEMWIPVLPAYRNADGVADITFSAVTSVTATSIKPSAFAFSS